MTLAEREELTAQTLEKLRSINTLDDLQASRDEIMDMMERFFRSASEVLKTFFDNMLSLDPEEQKQIADTVQDDGFLLNPSIMGEFDRLEQLPGAGDFMASLNTDMQERMGPFLQDYADNLGKMMENFMGGLVGGLADAMGHLGGGTDEESGPASDESDTDTRSER